MTEKITTKEKETVKKTAVENTPQFTKEQLLKSARFARRRDLLGALLDDNKTYTIAETETAIDKYLKGGNN